MSTGQALADPRGGVDCHAQPHGEHGEARITFTYWIFFHTSWRGVVSKCVDLFIPSLICHIFSVIDIDSIIIIEGDWTTSWPEEEDQENDISEGLNQFFYTTNYMSV